MTTREWTAAAIAVAGSILITTCSTPETPKQRVDQKKRPTLVLWAWDRYEDLRFLHRGEAEVAGLVATIQLKNGEASVRHRHLPLLTPNDVPLMLVVRLQSDGTALPAADSVAHWFEYIAAQQSRASSLQIDFDARESQRAWYMELLQETHTWFQHVSITALASWCMEPRSWLSGLSAPEIQEVVPMLFRMGLQTPSILQTVWAHGRFQPPCDTALGVSTDELSPWRPPARRIYVFSPRPWTRKDFENVCARLR